jgi:low affinity Fe/Cu permease
MPWSGWALRRRTGQPEQEDTASALRILRTHVAAQASTLSTIATQLGELTTMRMLLNELVRNHAAGFDQVVGIVDNQAETIARLAERLAGVAVLVHEPDARAEIGGPT